MNIRQRGEKDGKPVWRLRWSVYDPGTGERKWESETAYGHPQADGSPPRALQRRWLQRDAEIHAQGGAAYASSGTLRLEDHLTLWRKAIAPDVTEKTLHGYESNCRLYIVPYLGAAHISDLTSVQIQNWLNELRTHVGPRTVAIARGTLRTALAHAVRLGQLPDNPVEQTRAPRAAGERRRPGAFTSEESGRLLAAAYARTRLGPLLEFAWITGLRPSEFFGLLWEDVDLDAGMIHVRRSRVQISGHMIDQERTKTASGTRDLMLPRRAIEALHRQRLLQAEDRLASGAAYKLMGLVFTARTGNGLLETNVSRTFRKLRESLGLPAHPLYGMRHTAASMQIAAGVPIEVVSKRLGHRNISITVDTYGHLLPEANRDAARKMDEFLTGGPQLVHRSKAGGHSTEIS